MKYKAKEDNEEIWEIVMDMIIFPFVQGFELFKSMILFEYKKA